MMLGLRSSARGPSNRCLLVQPEGREREAFWIIFVVNSFGFCEWLLCTVGERLLSDNCPHLPRTSTSNLYLELDPFSPQIARRSGSPLSSSGKVLKGRW